MRGSTALSSRSHAPVAVPSQRGAPDWVLLFLVAAITTIGLIAVFSATAADAARRNDMLSDQFSIVIRQTVSLGIGAAAMALGASLPYRYLRSWVLPAAMAAVFVMLALLLFPNPLRGEPGPGGIAYRWLFDGAFRFQPAELAKLVLVVFAANFLDKRARAITGRRFLEPLIVYGFVILVAASMILKEPDLGTAMVVAGTGFFMLLAAGMDWKWLTLCLAGGLGAILGAAYISEYRWQRILSWMDPWADAHGDSYQAVQGLIALARGGWFGTGLGQGVQKLGYLPEKHTDFVFAVLAEELGLLGAGALLLLFAFIAWRGYSIAAHAPDRFGSLLASGITTMVVFQAFMNVAVVSGLFPVTGVPMPFISYGGTSLIVCLGAMGILLGVSRYSREGAESVKRRPGKERRV